MKVFGGTGTPVVPITALVLIIQLNTIVQLYVIPIIHKPAVTIKFSGNLDSGSETVTSTSFEYPYDSYVYRWFQMQTQVLRFHF